MITLGGGFGLVIVLHGLVKYEPVYLAGLIPLLVGVVLVLYALAFAPRD